LRWFRPQWVTAFAALVMILSVGDARAQQKTITSQPALPEFPTDPVAAKAFAVFDGYCSRCHQVGKLNGANPVSAFGNILRLDEIARVPSLVRPGLPDGSRLYTIFLTRETPHDTLREASRGGEPTVPEIEAVRDWIKGVAPNKSGCGNRLPITPDQTRNSIERVLARLPGDAARRMRFVSLTHLYNACASTAEMVIYRQAVIKLLNSLSWSFTPVPLDGVDDSQTVLRVDLSRIGWNAAMWDRITSLYPYTSLEQSMAGARIGELTGTAVPVLRGDWLVFAGSQPPLYYELLGLPDRQASLLKSFRIDFEANIAAGHVKRLAMPSSSVAHSGRLIERHAFGNGAYWTIYEGLQNWGHADAFNNLTSPTGAGAKPIGSLSIFSLPNGLNGFFITNADGERLNDVPPSIVNLHNQPTAQMTAGISCLGCHGDGVRNALNDQRAPLQSEQTIGKELHDRLLALYPSSEEFNRLQREDNDRLARAMTAAGLDATLALNGVDPIVALSARYERAVDLVQAAAELGLDTTTAPTQLAQIDGEQRLLARRLIQDTAPRRQFELGFAALAAKLKGEPAPPPEIAPGWFGVATQSSARPSAIDLEITTDHAAYGSGDLVSVSVRSNADCYLTLINIDRNGRGTVIFPNEFEQNNMLQAGKELKVPGERAPYQFRTRGAGRESVVGICNSGVRTADGIIHNFEKQRFTELGDYTAFLSRALELEERRQPSHPGELRLRHGHRGHERADNLPEYRLKPDAQARTAIQIEVK
jgi:mono/diheme cytochrome c family protein